MQALAETSLSVKSQTELDDLLVKNAENKLSNVEIETLDRLIAQCQNNSSMGYLFQ